MSLNIDYSPSFLDELDVERPARPWRIMNTLAFDLDWERRAENRLEYWTNTLGKAYTYGKGPGERTYLCRLNHPKIDLVRERIQARTGIFYEGCFLNFYRDGRDWLGWHSDNDPGIDHKFPIAVVSLGAERAIEWREISAKGMDSISQQHLGNGSLFLMPAGMQQTHVHRIPKMPHLGASDARMSLTFRKLIA